MSEETVEAPVKPARKKGKKRRARKRSRGFALMPPMLQASSQKRDLPPLDPLEASQEEARHAKEGNLKLQRAVDTLRTALETIVVAERDNRTGLPTTTQDLRGIAVAGLEEYSRLTGQSWRRHKLVGNWAGDRNLPDSLEE